MGNVRQHGKGWQLIYQVAGERRWETVRVETRSEALRLLKVREGEAADGRTAPLSAGRLRFEDLAAGLVCDYQLTGKRTLRRAQQSLDHLKASFGGRRAAQIAAVDVKTYCTKRQSEGAANGTINRELTALKRMFNLALREGQLYRKPQICMLRESSPRQGFFEAEQLGRVLAALPEYARPVAQFGFYSGWRLGEITTLQWDQVDFDARVVRLWPGTTKNREGRVLPLEGELWRIIEQRHTERAPDCPWVFHRQGERLRSFYKSWRRAVQSAGCPGRLFADLRRTAARNFRRAGLSENEAMALTGHLTAAMFRRYSIVAEADLRDAVWRSQAFLASTAPQVCQNCAKPEQGEAAPYCQMPSVPVR